ncbi:hypothetical protein ACLHDG_09060 [Sulfurovum sp. CS9]|uniref:hypothetical protein n=1 Tax=Sulfurovum sp. CS9 TaxID=3391146 RepID=UPI0039ECE1C5
MTFVHNKQHYKLMRIEEDGIVLKRKGVSEETFSKQFMKENFKQLVIQDRNGFRQV